MSEPKVAASGDVKKKWAATIAAAKGVINGIALVVVVFLTAYAAIISSISSAQSDDTSRTVQVIASCNQKILSQALTVLNERSVFTGAQSTANLELQKAQADLLRKSVQGSDVTPEEGAQALKVYFEALTTFVVTAEEAKSKAVLTPYPEEKDIVKCINDQTTKDKKE